MEKKEMSNVISLKSGIKCDENRSIKYQTDETSDIFSGSFYTIEGLKLTDELIDILYDLQDDNNSNIESLLNGIYEVEEIVLNPESNTSYGERLVMMQTLRDIRHLLDLLKVND